MRIEAIILASVRVLNPAIAVKEKHPSPQEGERFQFWLISHCGKITVDNQQLSADPNDARNSVNPDSGLFEPLSHQSKTTMKQHQDTKHR